MGGRLRAIKGVVNWIDTSLSGNLEKRNSLKWESES